MAINRYKEHLLILPEDDAYKDIANGFVGHAAISGNKISITKPAGGWKKLLDCFSETFAGRVRNYQHCHVLLLLDLDGDPKRYPEIILKKIPDDLKDRVFCLSCQDEAEKIKKDLGPGTFEAIGHKLAQSCHDETCEASNAPWRCSQLQPNEKELHRLAETVRPFLFE